MVGERLKVKVRREAIGNLALCGVSVRKRFASPRGDNGRHFRQNQPVGKDASEINRLRHTPASLHDAACSGHFVETNCRHFFK